jgi:hypothetical protein
LYLPLDQLTQRRLAAPAPEQATPSVAPPSPTSTPRSRERDAR